MTNNLCIVSHSGLAVEPCHTRRAGKVVCLGRNLGYWGASHHDMRLRVIGTRARRSMRRVRPPILERLMWGGGVYPALPQMVEWLECGGELVVGPPAEGFVIA